MRAGGVGENAIGEDAIQQPFSRLRGVAGLDADQRQDAAVDGAARSGQRHPPARDVTR